ncbi:hypothetical protein TRIUR3_29439 [Triticum urartu]|uniref:Uncharacterized protein n=1 Tax=Triticum urartu TaxID=4572 RepID=M7ZBX1_TRIUA|nr:hypothetical protein TRIUR3_29439 [Triticum urartu]
MEREERCHYSSHCSYPAIEPHADPERTALSGRRRHGVPEEEVKPAGRTGTCPRAVVRASPCQRLSCHRWGSTEVDIGTSRGLATPREPQVAGEVGVADEKWRMRGSKKPKYLLEPPELPSPDHLEEFVLTPPLATEATLRFNKHNASRMQDKMEDMAVKLACKNDPEGLQKEEAAGELRAGAEMIRNGTLQLMKLCDSVKQTIQT